MNSAFLSLSPSELQQAFADTHPIVFDGQQSHGGQIERFKEYALHYIHQHPEKLIQPILSFRTFSCLKSDNVVPLSAMFERKLNEDEDPDTQILKYLSPSSNSMTHLQIKDSERTFIIINYIDPRVVGAGPMAQRYESTIVRFQTYEDLRSVLQDMYTLYDQLDEEMTMKKFRVYSINGDDWSGQIIKDSQTLDQVFVKTSAKESILERIRVFKEEKQRAKRFGKPYKLNFLLYGVPGAGKTSMVKAIAKHLKKKLYIFNFSKELTDNKMSALLKDVSPGSVLVFEDVDSFFVHRESNGCNISFSSLINQLDGIRNSDAGLITILTANHVDKLDPALLRAGRMDLLVKFDYPEQEEVKMAFDAYLDHLTQEERNALFKKWYPLVKNKKIPMSAFTDFLYKDYLNIIEKTPEFLKEHEHLLSITTNANSDKMYL
jgi:ATPase family associated with various cellular activities (AAA)